jgi:sulfonate transport system substrate-binding protein
MEKAKMRGFRRLRPLVVGLAMVISAAQPIAARAGTLTELHLDFAYYNPVSLVLKDQGLVEEEFKKDDIAVQWVQSLGSNKALEFLNAGSLDFGSTAGAAALIGRINGNPIKSIYVFSKPEWTALVTRKDTGIKSIVDLKGKRVAVTRGTDPHIFLVRALQSAGLTQDDIQVVLLQHADGRAALDKGDVDAWAGLDPMMAQAETENGDVLFYRNADLNSYGVLNVREEFAAQHPDIVARLLTLYEKGRKWSLEHPKDVEAILAKAAHLSDAVAAVQIEQRTNLKDPILNDGVHTTIREAGLALQKAGVIKADVDVPAQTAALLDNEFVAKLSGN